jgi:CheY-like chemotaxis protein
MSRTISSPATRIGPILLVDDYDDSRVAVREALENAGYSVVEAKHGKEALDYLVSRREGRAALIVLDLQMPIMNGWELLEILRCYVGLASIPVIIVTAHELQLDQVQHQGVLGYLRAPYALTDLVEMVDACFSGRSVAHRGNSDSKKHAG